MGTYHWDVLVTYHWDVIGCFIWDLFETSWRRTDETSSLLPHETPSQHANKTPWKRTTETSLSASFETNLRRHCVVQRDVITTSPPRLVAGWDVTYFDSFGVEHFPKQIRAFVKNKNIKTYIFRIQANDSVISISFLLDLLILCLKERL